MSILYSEDMNLYENRLKTFNYYPKALRFMDKSLAKAGFYYAFEADIVKCFLCGIELRDWKPGEDPMLQHYKWSSNCYFIKMLGISYEQISSLEEGKDFESSYGNIQQLQLVQQQIQQMQQQMQQIQQQYIQPPQQPPPFTYQQPPQPPPPFTYQTPVTTQQRSIFGNPSVITTTQQRSMFGNPSIITTTAQKSMFGNPPIVTTTQQKSMFGNPSISQRSIFGNPSVLVTSAPQAVTTTTATLQKPNSFSNLPVTTTQNSSSWGFGNPSLSKSSFIAPSAFTLPGGGTSGFSFSIPQPKTTTYSNGLF